MAANKRRKGLAWCREVKTILQDRGHIVEGPGYGVIFMNGRVTPIHKDYFGCLDLISYHNGTYYGHQVTDPTSKSKHERKMDESGVEGWLWIRGKQGRRVDWRVFYKGMEITL